MTATTAIGSEDRSGSRDIRGTVSGPGSGAAGQLASEEMDQLRQALASNRRIGMAIGILMRDQAVDENEALTVLRRVSQHSNRKLRTVAEDVITWRCLPPH